MKYMFKRGVLVLVLLALVSAASSQSGFQSDLSGDFNNDCRVDFSDFLLWVQGFDTAADGSEYDLDFDGYVGVSDFFIFADEYYGNVCRLRAAKPAAIVGVPSIASLYGDLNYDDCVTSDDLDLWNQRYSVGVMGITSDMDLNNDGYTTPADRDVLGANMGQCFEKDFCTKQYPNEEDRNKCLIIAASKPAVVNDLCIDEYSVDGFSDLCSEQRMNLCNLIRVSVSSQNEINLKNLCHNKYKLYLQGIRSQLPGFK